MKKKSFAFVLIIIALASVTSGCYAKNGYLCSYRHAWRGY